MHILGNPSFHGYDMQIEMSSYHIFGGEQWDFSFLDYMIWTYESQKPKKIIK